MTDNSGGVGDDPTSIVLKNWRGGEQLRRGSAHGLVAAKERLTLGDTDAATGSAPDDLAVGGYRHGSWTAEWTHTAPFTELVASWQVGTPVGTWARVDVQVREGTAQPTPWFTLARWAYGDDSIRRSSVPGQDCGNATVDVDTLRAAPGRNFDAHRLRVTLYTRHGQHAPTPAVRGLSVMTSAVPDRTDVPVSTPAGGGPILLDVPTYSQQRHRGHLPEFGGGGAAWCSPTSTRMVLDYWGDRVGADALARLGPDHPDPQVDHAARHTYDYAYRGTGNWAFNTAYAAHAGFDAYVTRLRDLTAAERFLADDVPLVLSVSFRPDELDGAGYGTDGHLLVLTGLTRDGNVIVNDPAGDDGAGHETVRRYYDRRQFETVWLRTRRHRQDGTPARGPGGIAYVIRPA